MKVLDNFIFFSDATSASESNILSNPNLGSQLIVQASGEATSFEVQILGQTDINADFVSLSCISMTNFDVGENISATGIYAVPVDGVVKIKAEIKSVAGGGITVFGKLGAD